MLGATLTREQQESEILRREEDDCAAAALESAWDKIDAKLAAFPHKAPHRLFSIRLSIAELKSLRQFRRKYAVT